MKTLAVFTAALMLAASGPAQAAPVPFQVSAFSFTPGAGYGVDASELGGTLLDVGFTTAPGLHNFVLNAPLDASTFTFGTITLQETGIINANETDDLGVLATLIFLDPFVGLRQLTAIGTATTGLIAGPDLDLTIDWAPLLVNFGNGGLFRLTMNSVNFRFSGQSQDVSTTVTLLRAPQMVAEPAPLALLGAALLAGALRRRRS